MLTGWVRGSIGRSVLRQVVEFETSKLARLTDVRDQKLQKLQQLGSQALDTEARDGAENDMQVLMQEINDLNRQTRVFDFSESGLRLAVTANVDVIYHKRQKLWLDSIARKRGEWASACPTAAPSLCTRPAFE